MIRGGGYGGDRRLHADKIRESGMRQMFEERAGSGADFQRGSRSPEPTKRRSNSLEISLCCVFRFFRGMPPGAPIPRAEEARIHCAQARKAA